MATSAALTQAKQMFLDSFPGLGDAEGVPIAELRRCDDALFATFVPDDAVVEATDAGGVPSLWVHVPGADSGAVVVWFHGGGYTIGSPDGRRGIAAALSRASGARVLVPDYRLAPEHPFPAAVDDAVAAYAWVADRVGPERVVVGGDSAGGGLALAVLLAARDRGLPLPAGAAPLSPLADWLMTGDSYTVNKDVDPFVPAGVMVDLREGYLAGADPTDPLASPLYGDMTGLPPLLVLVGSAENLLDDARGVAAAARRAGVDVDLRVFPDMFHLWPLFASVLPEGQDAVEQIAAFVRTRTT